MAEMSFSDPDKRDAVAKTLRDNGVSVYGEGYSPFTGTYLLYYWEG